MKFFTSSDRLFRVDLGSLFKICSFSVTHTSDTWRKQTCLKSSRNHITEVRNTTCQSSKQIQIIYYQKAGDLHETNITPKNRSEETEGSYTRIKFRHSTKFIIPVRRSNRNLQSRSNLTSSEIPDSEEKPETSKIIIDVNYTCRNLPLSPWKLMSTRKLKLDWMTNKQRFSRSASTKRPTRMHQATI